MPAVRDRFGACHRRVQLLRTSPLASGRRGRHLTTRASERFFSQSDFFFAARFNFLALRLGRHVNWIT